VAVTNTIVQLGIALVYGAPGFRGRVAAALGAMSRLGGLAGLAPSGWF
jgi:hypothetical protein